ncbi:hypothetical protein [Sinobacterium caligoides]|nr:hypothetical protein [Sinobacterium caligoides]
MTLSCEGPPSQCSWVPENQWQSVIVLSNSLDALGNGVIETQFSVGITTVDSTFSVSAVPVPASAILFGSALLGLIGVRSKQRQ